MLSLEIHRAGDSTARTVLYLASPKDQVIGVALALRALRQRQTMRGTGSSARDLDSLHQTAPRIGRRSGRWAVNLSQHLLLKKEEEANSEAPEDEARWDHLEILRHRLLLTRLTGGVWRGPQGQPRRIALLVRLVDRCLGRLFLTFSTCSQATSSTPPTPQLNRRKLELLPRSGNPSATPSPLSSPKMGPTPTSTTSSIGRSNPFGAAR